MPRASLLRATLFDVAGRRIVIAHGRQALDDQEVFDLLQTVRWSRLGRQPDSFALLECDGCGLPVGQIRATFWGRDGGPVPLSVDAIRCIPLLAPHLGVGEERVVVRTALGSLTAIRLGSGIGAVEVARDLLQVSRLDEGRYSVNVGGMGGSPIAQQLVQFREALDGREVEDTGNTLAKGAHGASVIFVRREFGVLQARAFLRDIGEIRSSGWGALAAVAACGVDCPDQFRDFCEIRFVSGERLRVGRRSDATTLMLYGACRQEFACDVQRAPVYRPPFRAKPRVLALPTLE